MDEIGPQPVSPDVQIEGVDVVTNQWSSLPNWESVLDQIVGWGFLEVPREACGVIANLGDRLEFKQLTNWAPKEATGYFTMLPSEFRSFVDPVIIKHPDAVFLVWHTHPRSQSALPSQGDIKVMVHNSARLVGKEPLRYLIMSIPNLEYGVYQASRG